LEEGIKIKILVTGGAGFIGSHIVDKYIKDGHEVSIIDNTSSGCKENINPQAKFYDVDITDFEKINEILLHEEPEVINHHAALISVSESMTNPEKYDLVNVKALTNMINISKKIGVKKIIYPSSASVYGDTDKLPITEDSEKKPMSPYAKNKVKAEEILIESGLKYCILRYSNVYGPRQNSEGEAGVIAIFCDKILKNEDIVIFGDGEQTRDFIYVEDVAEANVLALEKDCIINISVNEGISINELFRLLKEISGFEKDAIYANPREGDILKSYLDNSKAKEKLCWEPKIGFKEGLRKTFEWFENSNK